MSNKMEESERIAALFLAKLSQNGLTPIDFEGGRLAQECAIDGESQITTNQRATATLPGVIEYLEYDDFIRIRNRQKYMSCEPPHYSGVALRERGLKLLGSLPPSLNEQKDTRNFGDRMVDAIEGGKWSVAAQLMRELTRTGANESISYRPLPRFWASTELYLQSLHRLPHSSYDCTSSTG